MFRAEEPVPDVEVGDLALRGRAGEVVGVTAPAQVDLGQKVLRDDHSGHLRVGLVDDGRSPVFDHLDEAPPLFVGDADVAPPVGGPDLVLAALVLQEEVLVRPLGPGIPEPKEALRVLGTKPEQLEFRLLKKKETESK